MKKNENIDKLVSDALDSLDNVNRAVSQPYLLTRINSRLNRPSLSNWDKVYGFIGKPVVAFTGLALLICVNLWAIIYKGTDSSNYITDQQIQVSADDFPNTVATIYDNENP